MPSGIFWYCYLFAEDLTYCPGVEQKSWMIICINWTNILKLWTPSSSKGTSCQRMSDQVDWTWRWEPRSVEIFQIQEFKEKRIGLRMVFLISVCGHLWQKHGCVVDIILLVSCKLLLLTFIKLLSFTLMHSFCYLLMFCCPNCDQCCLVNCSCLDYSSMLGTLVD